MLSNIEELRESLAQTDRTIAELTARVKQIARQQEDINEAAAVSADEQQDTNKRPWIAATL